MLRAVRHRRLRRLLDAFVDGALVDADAADLAAHLWECEACRNDAETTEQIKAVLARLDGASDAAPSPASRRRRRRAGGRVRSRTGDGSAPS